MKEQGNRNTTLMVSGRTPEARYAYYRRCQVFRKGGEQCKAPAETGSHICHAHAGQLATAVRRERERRAVLEAAVAQMRKQGKPECVMADLFTDFKGIQVTLAVMAQALIDGRVDCKTSGGLVVELQTWSKLLWMVHRRKTLPLIHTDDTDLKRRAEKPNLTTETQRHGEQPKAGKNLAANEREETRIATEGAQVERRSVRMIPAKVVEIAVIGRAETANVQAEKAHGPPERLRAA